MAERLKKLWQGEISLFKVFWQYHVGFNLIIGAIYVFSYLFINIWIILPPIEECTPLIISSTQLLLLPYDGMVMVGIWRSSSRYTGSLVWKIIAKLYAIAMIYDTCCYTYKNIFELCKLFQH